MVTRQSALRSSMPAFSAAAFKQGSKPANEIGSAAPQADKKAVKTGNGGDDLASLLAEVQLFQIALTSGQVNLYWWRNYGKVFAKKRMTAVCNVWVIDCLQHNRKFRPKPKYEPRIHSVKDIREVIQQTLLIAAL
jgi:hypothetical protein